ncbi:hypothetical protein EVAR_55835_1 [Eumeta japonica]|uniref:Uncharacterized protein n=1 Tax=Eumeta variegata TaxID=151549 RepID=A0A4C1YYN2_EUMVA|nr:hypothetical protein EVAR_55835_1 [Eumeta japonica]
MSTLPFKKTSQVTCLPATVGSNKIMGAPAPPPPSPGTRNWRARRRSPSSHYENTKRLFFSNGGVTTINFGVVHSVLEGKALSGLSNLHALHLRAFAAPASSPAHPV